MQFSLIENNNPTTFTKKKKKKEDTYSWCIDGYFTRQFHETTIQHMGPTHVLKDWSFEIFKKIISPTYRLTYQNWTWTRYPSQTWQPTWTQKKNWVWVIGRTTYFSPINFWPKPNWVEPIPDPIDSSSIYYKNLKLNFLLAYFQSMFVLELY